jgi:Dna[CI] antecedent, DciA
MPNKRRPHKRGVPKLTRGSSQSRVVSGAHPQAVHSVKDLLARSVPILSQAAAQTSRQAFWRPWLAARLPPELPPRITAVSERDGILVVFADSPAWSARLRYALLELQSQIREAHPDIKEVTVRVLPRPRPVK